MSVDELYERALALSSNVDDTFLELGRALRQLLDRDPSLFQQIVKKGRLGRRKAYYLVEVSRTFEPLAIPRDQLRKIGWPKFRLIAKHATPRTLDALLHLAENVTVKDLERHIWGWEKPAGNAQCMLRYFSPKDYTEFKDARVKHRAAHGARFRDEASAPLEMVAAPNDEPVDKTASDRQAKVVGGNGVKP